MPNRCLLGGFTKSIDPNVLTVVVFTTRSHERVITLRSNFEKSLVVAIQFRSSSTKLNVSFV